jgi:hypothetical protein
MNLKSLVLAGIATAVFSSGAAASSITYSTPVGSTQAGLPVNAAATFVTSADTITITLSNLQANVTSVAQNLSDLLFTTNGGTTTSATLQSSSGTERTIAAGGTFTDGGVVSTGWGLDAGLPAGTIHLDDLNGFAGPAHTIIGPPDGGGVYSNANGGIAGNGPHNPFLAQTALFTLHVPGVTSDTLITSATFSFNTESGDNVPGCVGERCTPTTTTPEPATLTLFGSGLAFLGTRLRRKKAAAGVR